MALAVGGAVEVPLAEAWSVRVDVGDTLVEGVPLRDAGGVGELLGVAVEVPDAIAAVVAVVEADAPSEVEEEGVGVGEPGRGVDVDEGTKPRTYTLMTNGVLPLP